MKTNDDKNCPTRKGKHLHRFKGGLLLLAATPVSAQQSGSTIELSTIVVEGGNQGTGNENGPVYGFVATGTRAGTKTETPRLEIPQSVSVVDRQQIEATGSRTVGEALRYTAGVRELFDGADPRYDQFQIRGFNAAYTGIYLDGLQLLAASGLPFKLEPYGLQRIDVLRGPSSVLYGGTNPGGLVNGVSKRPPTTPFGELTTGINSFGNFYGGFDIGGPLEKGNATKPGDGEWFYRLTGMGKMGPTQTDFSEDDRVFIAPALTWKPDADTSLTLLGSFQRDRTTGVPFLPYVGTVKPAPFGRIPTNFVTSAPMEGGLYNGVTREQVLIGYQFEKSLNDTFTFRQNARYSHADSELFSLVGFGYSAPPTPTSGSLTRIGFYATPLADLANIDNQLEARFATGALSHTALFGVDYKHGVFSTIQRFGFGVSPIDIQNPNYSGTFPGLGKASMNERNNQDQLGLYVQDQIKFGPLTLVLSGRLDEVWTKTDNYKTPGFSYSDQDSAFSGRAGLVYNVGFGLAPYISYSNSFEPLMGVTTSGPPLKPELGEQYEVGVKFQPENSHSFITIAAFDLTRQNFLVADPANFFNEKQSGEARSRGIEIEAVANLFGGLNLIASYTKFDIKNTENIDTALIGLAPGNTVDNYASTFLDYTIPDGAMKGFGGGFGVRYTGSAYVDELNKKSVPSYTLGDAVIHYEKDGWRGAVNVSNIFDKTYVAQCSSDIQCFYGERRKFTASLTYRW